MQRIIGKLEEYLESKGLRLTRQREYILQEFLKAGGHVTAAELYKKVSRKYPNVGIATIYRTLNLFKECGIAEAKSFGDGHSRFEKRINLGHHDHLICEACGAIVEFHNPQIEEIQVEVADEYRFAITRHNLEIFGVCEKCNKKGA